MKARVVTFVLLLAMPLAGVLLFGAWQPAFTEIPPVTVYVDPPDFAWPAYVGFSLPFLLALVLLIRPAWFGFRAGPTPPPQPDDPWWLVAPIRKGTWPWWGWAGLGLTALSWWAAWTRPGFLGPMRDHTFFPLWLGYIVTVDAWVFRRRGASLLQARPRVWLALFPASAVSWWYYEFINRFIQNWLYEGVDHFTPARYIIGASFAFSTVLPAMFETADLLATTRWFRTAHAHGPRIHPPPGPTAWTVLGLGTLGLLLMPRFPVALFWAAWLAPLGVLAGGLALGGLPTAFEPVRRGDFRAVLILALAALICGFFWEMWNLHAMPRWTYQVPWVNRFYLFEMPLVGYGGYLPFGPACWLWGVLLLPRRWLA